VRQIFTSQRLETVEGVARLLEEHGIAVHISQPRSYRSRRGGQFSYVEPVAANKQPAVWVRLPEDQPRAREILRQAGLLHSTRSYADVPQAAPPPPSPFDESGRGRWAWRLRIGLLAIIAAVAVFIWMGRHRAVPTAPAPTSAPAQAQPQDDEEIRVRITPAAPDTRD